MSPAVPHDGQAQPARPLPIVLRISRRNKRLHQTASVIVSRCGQSGKHFAGLAMQRCPIDTLMEVANGIRLGGVVGWRMGKTRLPTHFVSHGGGPWPWLEGEQRRAYERLERSLREIPARIGRLPRAFLIVTGHWETEAFAVSSAEAPGMIYDYRGFPEHTYHIHYRAPGCPALAEEVAGLLQGTGLAAGLDPAQGFDHGTFSVMQVIRPEADVPVVQLSVRRDFDPAAHIRAGQSLAPLRDRDVLILGSGLSYHNLRLWGAAAREPSAAFDAWLQAVLLRRSPARREAALLDWAKAPAARLAHPREDHLLPLMVAVGAAGDDAAVCDYHEDHFMGAVTASSFRFG
jgi:aromatic ring-opening dioxygenase catalytic subunit (LigB family)